MKKILMSLILILMSIQAKAYEIVNDDGFTLEIYGVLAVSAVTYDTLSSDPTISNSPVVENESRIGFRTGKQITNDLNLFMQIESGYVGYMNDHYQQGEDSGPGTQGNLGFRDTFAGVKGSFGKIRVGRVLTPMYEIIDWPYANPGLGGSWDWGTDVKGNYDRQSDTIRYDSNRIGDFTIALATGRGERDVDSSMFSGGSVKYHFMDKINFTLAYEQANKMNAENEVPRIAPLPGQPSVPGTPADPGSDVFTYLAAMEIFFPSDITLYLAYKDVTSTENDASNIEHTQNAYSVILEKWFDQKFAIRLGQTQNFESVLDGVDQGNSDSISSIQFLAKINEVMPYIRFAHRDINTGFNSDNDSDSELATRVGIEFFF